MIVLGSTHRGAFGRLFPGTVADELLRTAPCSVAVAPRGYARRYANRLQHVVAAFDGSPEAKGAVGVACDLASRAHGSLELLAVLQPPVMPVGPEAGYAYGDIVEARGAHLGEEVAHAVELLPPGIDCEARVVVRGDAARTLAEETADGADLLVTGSRGYGMLGRALQNGVSSKLVRTARCPVLVVLGRDPKA
jgi:nucleotide-binding universal stress UspA family protein